MKFFFLFFFFSNVLRGRRKRGKEELDDVEIGTTTVDHVGYVSEMDSEEQDECKKFSAHAKFYKKLVK